MLRVHFQEDVAHYFEKGRFSAVMLTIGSLHVQIRIDFIYDHVLVCLTKYNLFGELIEMYCRLLNCLKLWKTKSSPSFSSKE